MPRIAKMSARAQIDRMVRRIVKKFHPEQVILFGSHARGDAGPDSDIDLLIVMPVEGSKLEAGLAIRRALGDYSVPFDLVLSTPEEFAWRKDVVGTIEWPATREGKVVYAHA
jgi:predicted nucleotidyltransferase